jgi:hypothetical protein
VCATSVVTSIEDARSVPAAVRPLLQIAGLRICGPKQVVSDLQRIATTEREQREEQRAHRQSMAKQ